MTTTNSCNGLYFLRSTKETLKFKQFCNNGSLITVLYYVRLICTSTDQLARSIKDKVCEPSELLSIPIPKGQSLIYVLTRGKDPPKIHYTFVNSLPDMPDDVYYVQHHDPKEEKKTRYKQLLSGLFQGPTGLYAAYLAALEQPVIFKTIEHAFDPDFRAAYKEFRCLDRFFNIDIELYKIANETNEEPQLPEFKPDLEKLIYYPYTVPGEVDEEIYENFEEELLKIVQYHESEASFTGYNIGDNMITPNLAQYCMQPKKTLKVADVCKAVEIDGYLPLVGVMAKTKCCDTSGKLRSIYPTYLAYEAVLRSSLIDIYKDDPKRIKSFKEIPNNYKYSLDIKSCDKTLFPYLATFAHKHALEQLFLPIVVYNEDVYIPKQMTSGIYGTSIITHAFLKALVKYYNITDYAYQGDGLLCNTDLSAYSKFFRTQGDTFNGFYTANRCYARPEKIKLPRATTATKGQERYDLLYASYKQLGCNMEGLPAPKVVHKDPAQYCIDNGFDPCRELAHYGNENWANWDSQPVKGIKCTKTLRFKLKDFGTLRIRKR